MCTFFEDMIWGSFYEYLFLCEDAHHLPVRVKWKYSIQLFLESYCSRLDFFYESHECSFGRISEHHIVIIFFYERRLITSPGDICEFHEEWVFCVACDFPMCWIISYTTDSYVLSIGELDSTDGHLIFCQSSGLIRTYSSDGTECLD